jgi:hypothetical protein
MFIFLTLSIISCISVSVSFSDSPTNLPPGTIIATSPDFQKIYVGSPSIAELPDGSYVASNDWFGPGTTETTNTMTTVHSSKDKGKTWSKLCDIKGQMWSNLFVHKENLYLFGCSHLYGNLIIRRSQDGGKTWTEPKDSQTGLLLKGNYHTAPCPIQIHQGKIWRAFELVTDTRQWGNFDAMIGSVSVDADILDASQWVYANPFPYNKQEWRGSTFLEGNVVLSPEQKILNILRAESVGSDKAVILDCSDDGKKLTSREKASLINFPGGQVKFTIRFDPKSGRYWSLTSKQNDPPAFRNYLVLMSSKDLIHWNIETILFRHHEQQHHAWQYIDWIFEGNDNIVFVSRTAWDGSHNAHDSNYMTFHRIENFRNKTSKDDAPWLGQPKPVQHRPAEDFKTLETTDLTVRGTHTEIGTFDNDQKAFVNRNYAWLDVPEQFKGWKFTYQNAGGKPLEEINIRAKKDTNVYMITYSYIYSHWKLIDSESGYSDTIKSRINIYERPIKKGEEIKLPQWGFTGGILLFKE